jgi:hypothetical protein
VAGQITAKGRTLYINNGAPLDKLIVKVKKGPAGDKTARLSGIITDSGLRVVKLKTSVDRVLADGAIGNLKTVRGDIGHRCHTKLHNIRFDSDEGKSKIKAKFGDIVGNVLVGTVSNAVPWYEGVLWTNSVVPETVLTESGAKMLAALGGNIGREETTRHCDAGFIKKVVAKTKKKVGGEVINYSIFLADEYKAGSGQSIAAMLVGSAIDTSASNAYTVVVCGQELGGDAVNVTNWAGYPVKYTIKKIKAKGDLCEGTYVLDAQPDKKKIKGVDKATYLINP